MYSPLMFFIHTLIWFLLCRILFCILGGKRLKNKGKSSNRSPTLCPLIFTPYPSFSLSIIHQAQIQSCDSFTSFPDTAVVCLPPVFTPVPQPSWTASHRVKYFLPSPVFGPTTLSSKVVNVATRLESFRQKHLPQSSAPDWNFEWHHHLLRFLPLPFMLFSQTRCQNLVETLQQLCLQK